MQTIFTRGSMSLIKHDRNNYEVRYEGDTYFIGTRQECRHFLTSVLHIINAHPSKEAPDDETQVTDDTR